MRSPIALAALAVLLTACAKEPAAPVVTTTTAVAEPVPTTTTAPNENLQEGTWSGQIKVAEPVSTLNYVGAESGDWVPMRFRNDSEAGRKLLAVCANDDMCEFTGAVEFLDEVPPPDASAVARIERVDSVKKLPKEQ